MKFPLRILTLVACAFGAIAARADDWIDLFDGKTLDGWQANESPDSWQIEDFAIVTRGTRSHLFYVGPVANHDFKNFELSLQVMTEPASNSGVYVHTKFQPDGWPAAGYECQVINSTYPPREPTGYVERKLGGSIYAIRNTWKAPAKDGEWFNYRIKVQGKTLQTFVDGQLICEYTEAENPWRPDDKPGRLLSSGTFAFQCHDPKSVVRYKDIKVRLLPDELTTPKASLPDAELDHLITELSNANYPLVDFGISVPSSSFETTLLYDARKYGVTLGVQNADANAERRLSSQIAFHGWRSESRPWVGDKVPPKQGAFDYLIVPYDVSKDRNALVPFGAFIDVRSVNLIEVQIPEGLDEASLAGFEDLLGVLSQRTRVALLVNDRNAPPSIALLRRAKEAGIKVAFSSGGDFRLDPARLKARLQAIKSAELAWYDIWTAGY